MHGVVREGAPILELGCGTGRITHRLIELGHPVRAVDQSAEMLSYVRRADLVLSDIETVELDRQFEVVLLASNLVNTPDDEQRRAFLATCAKHVTPSGVVLIQRYAPDWDPSSEVDEQLGPVRLRLHEGRKQGTIVAATVEYSIGERVWTHSFVGRLLDDAEMRTALADVGLTLRRRLDQSGTWVEAATDVAR